jgi:acetolactate synthase-1/2/3 large subunit
MHLAEALPAPIVTTNLGKAAVPGDHPLCLGYTVGQKPVRQYLEQCDLMLAVGTRFSYLATDCWTMKFPETVIHIDIDAGVIGRNYDVTQGLVGDAGGILEAILDRLGERSPPPGDRRGEVAALKAAVHSIWTSEIPREHQLIQDIRAALPRSTIVAGDPSMCAYLAWQMLDLYAPRSYLYPMGGATLGYGFPSALGAKAAHPDRPVVAICGDAGFLFSCQELATAVQYDLNIVTLIFNDSGYGALRVQQDDVFGRRSEVDLRSPDFVALAESFGAAAQRVEDLDQLQPVLSAALGHSCPTVIEVPVALSVQNLTT